MKSRGQPIYLNINSAIGSRCVLLASVAAGAYNAQLHSIARQVRRYRYKVFFSWNHEMQEHCTGTAADYRASYQRVRKVFKQASTSRTPSGSGSSLRATINHYPAKAAKFLPGQVDLIGVDGYNRAGDWRGVKEIFAAAHKFATNHGHRLFIGEIGCAEDPNDCTAKARWISNAYDTFRRGTSPPSSGPT